MPHLPKATNALGRIIACQTFIRYQISNYMPDNVDLDLETPIDEFGTFVVAGEI